MHVPIFYVHDMSLCYDVRQIMLEDNDTFDRLTLGKETIRQKQDLSFPAIGYDALQESQ